MFSRMGNEVAALIVNYNMPERAEAIARQILTHSHCDVYLIDNGSDLVEPSHLTNIHIRKNVQTTNGWLLALDSLKRDYFAYWFLITSAELLNIDTLSPMTRMLKDDPEAVGVHPALTPDSTTAWTHMLAKGGPPRRVGMIDNIASLYRAEWFNEIGRFDPRLTYGWGIDLETGYLAGKQGRTIWIDERVQVRKVTDIGYSMNRMNMTAAERRVLARANMTAVFTEKYGEDWEKELERYINV